MGRAMRHVEPEIEQQGSLEQKLVAVFRDTEAVEHPFQGIASQQQVVVQPLGPSFVEEAGADGGADIAEAHVRLSR